MFTVIYKTYMGGVESYAYRRFTNRAIARHHLAQARPHIDLNMINSMLTWAKFDKESAKHCAKFGVSVAIIN